MDIGITGTFGGSPRRDMGFVREFAACCESVGFAALYMPEHVVFFTSYRSAYPYTRDGSTNWGPDTGIYDPLITATVAAGATSRLRLVTSILILPERPALLTAKEVMSVDHASGGRFELGIGVGWSSEEYAALGVPWEDRGQRCDEYIEAMRAVWRNDCASYHGKFVSFDDAVLKPHPIHGDVKILVGGESMPAMRRAALLADGWYGWWASEGLEPHVARMSGVLDKAGRERSGFSMRVGVPVGPEAFDEVVEKAEQARALGVDEFVVGVGIPTRDFEQHLRRWADALGLSGA
jgi:probable F420-dependent oxidoreductase